MADGKGYNVIVKINLPPEKQYHSGHSLIVQGDSAGEVETSLANILVAGGAVAPGALDQARFILLRFVEYALGDAVKASLREAIETSDGKSGPTAPVQPEPASDLASPTVLKAVAKKTGKSLEELGELTKAQATEMLKGGK